MDKDGKREWPVDEKYKGHSPRHENNYGAPRANGTRLHKGIDINIGTGNFDKGAPVYATHDGYVSSMTYYIQDYDAGGTRIKITSHDGDISTFYMHLNSISKGIKVGDKINEGTQIGTIGGTGNHIENEHSAHLHYEIIFNGKHINPTKGKDHLIDPQLMIHIEFTLDEVTVFGVAHERENNIVTIPLIIEGPLDLAPSDINVE